MQWITVTVKFHIAPNLNFFLRIAQFDEWALIDINLHVIKYT